MRQLYNPLSPKHPVHEEELREIGLTDNEVRIYLFLLKRGISSPSEVATELGFHRGYVYDALERLHEKEVVSALFRSGKKHYQAASPTSIAELLRLRLESFEAIVPVLMGLASFHKESTTVELHKGKKVYRTLLKDTIASIRDEKELYVFGVDEERLMEKEPIYMQQYFTLIKERKLKEKVIIRMGGARLKHPSVTYRELPEEYIGNTSQFIYKDKVATLILGVPDYLIVVENSRVADTSRKQFELLWSAAHQRSDAGK